MPRRAKPATPAPMPIDVRAMTIAARLVFALAVLALLAVGAKALARSKAFDLTAIQIEGAQGDLQRTNLATVRANALPQLKGNFFSLDLEAAQRAFESVPWVRKAVVRRAWPNRLSVRIEEHVVAALWKSEAGDDRLVNRQGEVFDANLGEVDEAGFATLQGPDAAFAAPMLALLGPLDHSLQPLSLKVESLELSLRGSWRAELSSGADLEMGRGDAAEVLARVGRFVRTLPQAAAQLNTQPQALREADLRHQASYAVKFAGLTTTASATPAASEKKQ